MNGMNKYFIGTASLILLVVILSIASCKEAETDPEIIFKGKYVDKIERDMIFFEDNSVLDLYPLGVNRKFYLTRHAEKDTLDKENPDLTDKGLIRSYKLAEMLKATRLDAIYSTWFARNLQTVDSLSQLKGMPIHPYLNKNAKETFEYLRDQNEFLSILICGHNNTVPVITNFLAGRDVFNHVLDENDYDNFIVVLDRLEGDPMVLQLKYRQ
jgi:2,3-bisphosphoglycerate-dependent phosphoglycerate mutase